MPIALVPEGFTLKKVTKAQEDALKDHRKHEDIKAFLSSDGAGQGIGLGIIGVALFIFMIPILKNFLKLLSEDDDFKGKTISQIMEEEEKGDPEISFLRLLTVASTGIPETLMAVVIPAPIQEEIKQRTGLDLGGFFSQLRGKI